MTGTLPHEIRRRRSRVAAFDCFQRRKAISRALLLFCASRHIGVDEVDEGLLIVDRGVK